MRDRAIRGRPEHWIGAILAGAAALATGLAATGMASAEASLPLQAVGWQNETLPGAVCKSSRPIRLHNHVAKIAHTGFGNVNSSGSDPDLVVVAAAHNVTFGQLGGVGPAAAVDVVCSNNGGTADGQLRFAGRHYAGQWLGEPAVRTSFLGQSSDPAAATAHAR